LFVSLSYAIFITCAHFWKCRNDVKIPYSTLQLMVFIWMCHISGPNCIFDLAWMSKWHLKTYISFNIYITKFIMLIHYSLWFLRKQNFIEDTVSNKLANNKHSNVTQCCLFPMNFTRMTSLTPEILSHIKFGCYVSSLKVTQYLCGCLSEKKSYQCCF